MPPRNWIKWKVIGRLFKKWQILLFQLLTRLQAFIDQGSQNSHEVQITAMERVIIDRCFQWGESQPRKSKIEGGQDLGGGVSASVMGSWSVQVEKSAVTLNVPHSIWYWPKTYHILGSVEDIVRTAQPSSCQRGYLLIVTSVVAVSFSRRQTTHMSSYRAQSDTQCRQNLAHTQSHTHTRMRTLVGFPNWYVSGCHFQEQVGWGSWLQHSQPMVM